MIKYEMKQQLKDKDIYIFKLNTESKKLLMGLCALGIYVKGFVDEQKDFKYLDEIIIAEADLPPNDDYIVLCIDKKNAKEPRFVYFECLNEIAENSSYDLVLQDEFTKEKRLVFPQRNILYSIKHFTKKGKKLILYGKAKDISYVINILRYLDVNVPYGVSFDEDTENIEGVEIKNPYDLLYENEENIAVWVLEGSEKSARYFINTSGLNENIFYTSSCGSFKIFRQICFDPSLGYNLMFHGETSFVTLKTKKQSEKKIKIGIVGGSTSDVTLYNEISWPETLIKIADDNNIDMTIYAGGTSSYGSSQELIKFIRGMSNLNLDILISYSRVNDTVTSCIDHYPFIHNYQKEIFNIMVENYKFKYDYSNMEKRLFMGYGFNDFAVNWLNMERMMFAIYKEYDIKTGLNIIIPA